MDIVTKHILTYVLESTPSPMFLKEIREMLNVICHFSTYAHYSKIIKFLFERPKISIAFSKYFSFLMSLIEKLFTNEFKTVYFKNI